MLRAFPMVVTCTRARDASCWQGMEVAMAMARAQGEAVLLALRHRRRTAGRGAAVSKRLQRSRNGGQQQRAVGVQVANVNVYIAFLSQPILKQIQNVRGCLKGLIAFNHNCAILKPQFSFTACNVVVIGFRRRPPVVHPVRPVKLIRRFLSPNRFNFEPLRGLEQRKRHGCIRRRAGINC